MATKRMAKGAYLISAVAEMYEIHPQMLRLYEREGLLSLWLLRLTGRR
jgi:MerR family transcriptional regulator, heat shock protein HspR